MVEEKLISMVDYILEIDWLTTTEFCNKYNYPHPYFTGEVKSSAKQFLNLDAIKHRMFVEYAKFLNKQLTLKILTENFGFALENDGDGFPIFYKNKYKITNTSDGFWLEQIDCYRIQLVRVSDLIPLNLDILKRNT
jgi:hypothetical protein